MQEVGLVSDKSNLQQWVHTHKTQLGIALISSLAIGAGVGLGAQLNKTKGHMKTMATSIKLADTVLKAAKAIHTLHSPTPTHIIFLTLGACKALAKGASKGLIIRDKNGSFKKLSKTLKASEGALNVVRYSSALGAADPWEYVIKGYKLSKSVFNVFDGVNGVRAAAARGYGVIKGGLEGVGVIIKALGLSKQMYGILIQGFGISHRAFGVLSEEYRNERKEEKKEEEKVCVQMGTWSLYRVYTSRKMSRLKNLADGFKQIVCFPEQNASGVTGAEAGAGAIVEHKDPEGKSIKENEAEDLELKLRRIIENVPLRVNNTSGSSAGSGSGDFHQYRQMRRREQDRLTRMDVDYERRKELEEFNARREERIKAAEERTSKKRAKRQKKKEKGRQKKKKIDSSVSGQLETVQLDSVEEGSSGFDSADEDQNRPMHIIKPRHLANLS